MGYTQYWKTPKALSEKAWAEFTKDVKKVFVGSKGIIQKEDDDKSLPVVNSEMVRFNGIEEDGHETFLFSKEASSFSFCKTARKPYDKYVTACLILAKLHFGNAVEISSDGVHEDWIEGHLLIQEKTDLVIEFLLGNYGLSANKLDKTSSFVKENVTA